MHGARASARDDRNKGETLRKLISLVVLVGALVWAAPAGAIINGEPDGNDHPYVGMTFNDEFVCSGTLISPTVFLTAGHCADFLKVPEQPGEITADVTQHLDMTMDALHWTEIGGDL